MTECKHEPVQVEISRNWVSVDNGDGSGYLTGKSVPVYGDFSINWYDQIKMLACKHCKMMYVELIDLKDNFNEEINIGKTT